VFFTLKGSKKYRNYSFLIYPEGLADNFIEVLNDSGGKGFYILHDMDKLDDGTDKKAHYHVMVMFENPRSLSAVSKIALRCGAANGFVQPLKNAVAYARYLCHMDNPNKYRYESCEVTSFGGTDYEGFCETAADREKKKLIIVHQMVDYICDNVIYSYADLFEYCCSCRQDWLKALLNPSVGRSIMEYIKSKSWTDECLRRANSKRINDIRSKE